MDLILTPESQPRAKAKSQGTWLSMAAPTQSLPHNDPHDLLHATVLAPTQSVLRSLLHRGLAESCQQRIVCPLNRMNVSKSAVFPGSKCPATVEH